MSTLSNNFFDKINQITPLEHSFTEVLDAIALKPKTLYFYGKLPENMLKTTNSDHSKTIQNDEKSTIKNRTNVRPPIVAIVGSRHNTHYGEEIAYKLAYELGKRGVIIISGLAYGIDSIAHRGCLAAGGVTIAVLGNPIDKIHPTAHTALAREIVEKDGAIISEYAPSQDLKAGLAPGEYFSEDKKRKIEYKTSFLYRNRIISGLSDIIVIVEAAEKSGSLNTATHALEQGKTVFAVPGNITNPYSQGCNKLIKQGAIPYTEPRDIIEVIFPEDYSKHRKRSQSQNIIGDTDVETKILQAIVSGARSGEQIMQITHLPPEVFNATVTLLEIKARLRPLGMNNWGLA